MSAPLEEVEKSLPARVVVDSILSSRYPDHKRPMNWDRRKQGLDRVSVRNGEEVQLISDGQQSPPQPGWELLLTSAEETDSGLAFRWTLYGLVKQPEKAA